MPPLYLDGLEWTQELSLTLQHNGVTPHITGHPLKVILLDLPYHSAADQHGR